MSSNASAAGRVASTIGVFKWIIVIMYATTGVILMFTLNANEDIPAWTALAAPVGALMVALGAWVLFGWFQHTLAMLAAIAANTQRESAHGQSSPDLVVPS